jgi:hypothetical protein
MIFFSQFFGNTKKKDIFFWIRWDIAHWCSILNFEYEIKSKRKLKQKRRSTSKNMNQNWKDVRKKSRQSTRTDNTFTIPIYRLFSLVTFSEKWLDRRKKDKWNLLLDELQLSYEYLIRFFYSSSEIIQNWIGSINLEPFV